MKEFLEFIRPGVWAALVAGVAKVAAIAFVYFVGIR